MSAPARSRDAHGDGRPVALAGRVTSPSTAARPADPAPGPRREWSDAELLDMLARREAGQSRTEIAEAHGATRNQVIGLLHRIDRDTDASEVRE
ncbi:hypothetical protein LNKW23_18190 [Paralimibaculum aggregatum]|uniref:Uncharacterized protein n=1 Tax=Paralimibaculum aggregatum TaxID=3036245 RepID=A0ABQ6LH37_9RHOB|nr:hypothetical protein [Limibaculum sp. NKW23]GMG82606.1 hypothetical protein LNKW23_18190 [Limibaculum sp. NKW23]